MMKRLLRIYDPALDWALGASRAWCWAAPAACWPWRWCWPSACRARWRATLEPGIGPGRRKLAQGMGSEFMPTLNEGSLLFMPVLLPSTSLTEIKRLIAWQDQVMKQVPEVQSAAGKLGRSETATDPAPVEMIETTIELKPESEWRPGMTQEKLIAELTEKLSQAPGYVPGFLHPIEGRILMLSTGIRAQVGVKILGDNLDALQKKAFEVEKVMREIPGAAGVAPSRLQGKPYLEHRGGPRGHGPLRPARARRARRGGNRPGRQERHHHHRGPPAVPDPGALPAGRARRHRAAGRRAGVHARRQGHPAGPGRQDQARGRPQRDRQRERPAAGLRAGQRAGARPGRLRQGSPRADRAGDQARRRA